MKYLYTKIISTLFLITIIGLSQVFGQDTAKSEQKIEKIESKNHKQKQSVQIQFVNSVTGYAVLPAQVSLSE
ncbi:MAG: hypothetical protein KJ666_10500, partial [Bacteroidetes bacterium]|nr:hypothetical protein [Bacteroidota bacterium]